MIVIPLRRLFAASDPMDFLVVRNLDYSASKRGCSTRDFHSSIHDCHDASAHQRSAGCGFPFYFCVHAAAPADASPNLSLA